MQRESSPLFHAHSNIFTRMSDTHTCDYYMHIIQHSYALDMHIRHVKLLLLLSYGKIVPIVRVRDRCVTCSKRSQCVTMNIKCKTIKSTMVNQPNSHTQFTTTSRELNSGSQGLQRPIKIFGQNVQSI